MTAHFIYKPQFPGLHNRVKNYTLLAMECLDYVKMYESKADLMKLNTVQWFQRFSHLLLFRNKTIIL